MPLVIMIFIRALAAIESNNEILGDNGIQEYFFPLSNCLLRIDQRLADNRFIAHFTDGLRINDDCSAIVGEPKCFTV